MVAFIINRFKLTFLFACLFFANSFATTGNISLLKGSYDCLAPHLKHLSPFHGAVALESDYIRKIYKHEREQKTATEKLAGGLFHLVGANFDISSHHGFSRIITPEKLGTILGAIECFSFLKNSVTHKAVEEFNKRVKSDAEFAKTAASPSAKYKFMAEFIKKYPTGQFKKILTQKSDALNELEMLEKEKRKAETKIRKIQEQPIQAEIEKLTKQLETLGTSEDAGIKALIIEQIRMLKETKLKMHAEPNPAIREANNKYEPRIQELQKIVTFENKCAISASDDFGGNIFLDDFINLIQGSLDECGYFINSNQNPETNYTPYTTQILFLGAFYKAMQTRNDLINFFRALHRTINNIPSHITLAPFLNEEWKNKWLQPTEECINGAFPEIQNKNQIYEWAQENMLPLKDQEPNELFNHLAANFENIVFYELMRQYHMGLFPALLTNQFTQYLGHYFTNCGETVILNLCNIILYDHKTGTINYTEKARELGLNLHPSLINFYEHGYHKAYNEETHKQWLNIVENIPGASYIKMGKIGTQTQSIPNDDIVFITFNDRIPNEKREEQIGQNKYIVFDNTVYTGFELAILMRSFIALTNHLFGLNLFPDARQAISSPTFITTYLPQVMHRLGFSWKLHESLFAQQADPGNEISTEFLDASDKQIPSVLVITRGAQRFQILLGVHGDLKTEEQIQPQPKYTVSCLNSSYTGLNSHLPTAISLLMLFKNDLKTANPNSIKNLLRLRPNMSFGVFSMLKTLSDENFIFIIDALLNCFEPTMQISPEDKDHAKALIRREIKHRPSSIIYKIIANSNLFQEFYDDIKNLIRDKTPNELNVIFGYDSFGGIITPHVLNLIEEDFDTFDDTKKKEFNELFIQRIGNFNDTSFDPVFNFVLRQTPFLDETQKNKLILILVGNSKEALALKMSDANNHRRLVSTWNYPDLPPAFRLKIFEIIEELSVHPTDFPQLPPTQIFISCFSMVIENHTQIKDIVGQKRFNAFAERVQHWTESQTPLDDE